MSFSMKSLRLGEAFSLTMRTMPILLIRLGVYVAFWLVSLLYLAITGGVAYLVGQAVPALGVILFIAALVGIGPLYGLAKRYVLYIVKAAHIAIIAELLARGELPAGINQLQWGREQVQARFGEASAMFVVDEIVSSVVNAFTRTVYRVASFLPGDTLRNLARVVERIIRFSLDYVDEAILARAFWTKSKTTWESARDGVILYGMVWKPLLINAIALMVLSYLPFLVALLIFSAPVGAVASIISGTVAGWSIIATLILAFLIKVAVGDAFAMTAMIAAYQRATEGLEPDPAIAAKLDSVSDKFGELTRRASEEISSGLGRVRGPAPDALAQGPGELAQAPDELMEEPDDLAQAPDVDVEPPAA